MLNEVKHLADERKQLLFLYSASSFATLRITEEAGVCTSKQYSGLTVTVLVLHYSSIEG